MRALSPPDVLVLWEHGARRHALDRSALLCAWARPELPADRIADLPLGVVTASLLQLRAASFGPDLACHVDCEHCAHRLEVKLSVPQLLQAATPDGAALEGVALEAEVAGLRVRAPSLRDLAAVADHVDAEQAAWELLARCTGNDGSSGAALSGHLLRAVGDALEALDPAADLVLGVHCEACGREGVAQVDAGVLLWDEIEARARELLYDVHRLARAYSWSEAEILALSPARRAGYLALVDA